MTVPTKTQRLSAWRGWRALRHFVFANPLYFLTLQKKVPKSLRALPPNPWPEDAETAQSRNQEHVAEWIKANRRWSEIPWRADVLGQRLSNWFAAQQYLLPSNDPEFKNNFLKSIAAQAQHLARIVKTSPSGAGAFPAIKGLIHCGVCLPDNENAIAAGLQLLGQEIERQVLPDGGHIQRNPSLLLQVMKHLIDIRDTLEAEHKEAPAFLQGALDRMAPMLRGFRMGDGRLALFNGSKEEDRSLIDTVLGQSKARGKAISSAPHCGFQRISSGRATLIIDTGGAQTDEAARGAHAGTLSFEFSVGKTRLIVNCGDTGSGATAWRDAARATAAHSTLSVDGANSSSLSRQSQPHKITCNRRQADGATWLETSHDGYQATFGLIHERKLFLDATGADLRGEDILTGFGGENFKARFHLHPQVKASLVGDGLVVLLKPPTGPGWRFRASGGEIALEESIYMGQPGTPQRCEQITLSGPLSGAGARLKWALSRGS